MAAHNTDENIATRITSLVEEERQLWNDANLDSHGTDRLAAIRVELDQCWDLLRQRDALREFGKDPNRAHPRPPSIVENYEG
jgi:hypothetical protein